jgi:hypothetical protein
MQKAAVRRLLSIVDLVGSAALIAVPLVGGVGLYTAFPGVIGIALSAASLYWASGDRFRFCTGVASFMLFAAYTGWASAMWGTYSSLGDVPALGLTLVFALVAIAYLFMITVIQSYGKDQK